MATLFDLRTDRRPAGTYRNIATGAITLCPRWRPDGKGFVAVQGSRKLPLQHFDLNETPDENGWLQGKTIGLATPADRYLHAYPAANWGIYDAIVRDAKASGIQVYFLLTGGAPRWANGAGMPSGTHSQWKPNAVQFGAFAKAVGTRYNGRYKPKGQKSALPRVSFWSIWNEPNYGFDLAPQTTGSGSIETGRRSTAGCSGTPGAAWPRAATSPAGTRS